MKKQTNKKGSAWIEKMGVQDGTAERNKWREEVTKRNEERIWTEGNVKIERWIRSDEERSIINGLQGKSLKMTHLQVYERCVNC